LSKYQAIIFDFDGVLVESVDVKTQAFAAMYASYGEEVMNKVIEYHLKHSGISRFEKFQYFHKVLLKEDLTPEKEKELGEEFSELVVEAVIAAPLVKGAGKFLDVYYKKVPLFVASGTPDAEIKDIIERRRMAHYFVSVHGSPAKKEEIINRICDRLGFDRSKTIMVGDSTADYEGARKSGVCFLGRVHDINIFPKEVSVIRDFNHLPEQLQ
jgi:HAD superfamily hydrolase (TIGR01549 family)